MRVRHEVHDLASAPGPGHLRPRTPSEKVLNIFQAISLITSTLDQPVQSLSCWQNVMNNQKHNIPNLLLAYLGYPKFHSKVKYCIVFLFFMFQSIQIILKQPKNHQEKIGNSLVLGYSPPPSLVKKLFQFFHLKASLRNILFPKHISALRVMFI